MIKGATIGKYTVRQVENGVIIANINDTKIEPLSEENLKLLLRTYVAMQEGKPLPTQQVVRQEFNFHQKGDNCMFVENIGTMNIDMRRKK